MIESKEVAKAVSDTMLEVGAKLDQSLIHVQAQSSGGEFIAYRSVVPKLLEMMLAEVMNPLYKRHPDLKPRELD